MSLLLLCLARISADVECLASDVQLLGERKSCYAGAFAYMAIFISIGFATEGWYGKPAASMPDCLMFVRFSLLAGCCTCSS